MSAEKASTPDDRAPHPTQIGPYRILEEIGHGGMGVVYRAEQREPVRRMVALKVVQAGLATKEVLARFALERRALAAMSHRCIAKVLDAGATDKGEPYFVMELVEGLPLTDYCDKHRLGLNDRLKLFQQVCDGVQHAHNKGVVHRDLKPGNVLVVREGEQAVAKILDFGLAKATNRDFLDATLFTEKDRVLGTPEYMSPEQASGDGEGIDARSDIYSLGVMLYELLCGELPFPTAVLKKAGVFEALRLIREQEPQKPSTKLAGRQDSQVLAEQRRTTVAVLRRALAGDLDWVVLKAMAKEPERRYDAATALAAEVGRYLEHLPVLAGPPSAGYRLKKFVRRYRVQVAAAVAVLAAIVAGGVGTWLGFREAQANEQVANERAKENAKLAAAETAAKERASANAAELASKVREFDQLAGVVLYERTIAHEAELYPAWPGKIEAMERWLREDCGRLLAMRGEIERTVQDLRGRALPLTAEEIEADRREHPRFAEWEKLSAKVGSMQRAQEVRGGKVAIVEPELPAELRGKAPGELNAIAWPLVDWAKDDRAWGREDLALACARAAVAAASGEEQASIGDTLAWALFFSGRDDDALAASRQALADAPADKKKDFEGYLQKVEEHVAAVERDGAVALAAAVQQLEALTAEIGARRTWRFELESQRFLHETLTVLLGKLASLDERERAGVAQRLTWAQKVQALSLAHPNAKHTWAEARAAIAKADDVVASRLYAGRSIELRAADITGLVPIGRNPVTKLWEFYELRSAWDGEQDPAAIAIPEHKADGSIEVTGATGIVFVLLPGGTVTLGSQDEDPKAPFYDPQHRDDETLHEVTLAPFFLARHELTQGQWLRLWMWDEDLRQPSQYAAGSNVAGRRVERSNPVETVDWPMCDRLLWRHGLVLPTEAQWEYGCRAGTTTPWWPGQEPKDLAGAANLLDQTGARAVPSWGNPEPFDDRFVIHAPVGSFAPNGFGLYDVHGNVWEWCRDWYGAYGSEGPGDGLRSLSGSAYRCDRGGSFDYPAADARSGARFHLAPTIRNNTLGVRPARTSRL